VGVITDLTGPVLGLAGLAFGWRERTIALEHERTLADLQAVRSVIEEGAIHLHRVAYALDRARGSIHNGAPEHYLQLQAYGQTYDELCERMKVRMRPEHDVTRHFVAANESALDIYRALGMIQQEAPAEDRDVRADRAKFIDQQRARFNASFGAFKEHRENFVSAAADAAGARLAPSTRAPMRFVRWGGRAR